MKRVQLQKLLEEFRKTGDDTKIFEFFDAEYQSVEQSNNLASIQPSNEEHHDKTVRITETKNTFEEAPTLVRRTLPKKNNINNENQPIKPTY